MSFLNLLKASLDILCFNTFNLKNEIMKIEHKKIFRGPSNILKNISLPINICLKYFMAPTKTLRLPTPTYLMYGPLGTNKVRNEFIFSCLPTNTGFDRFINLVD